MFYYLYEIRNNLNDKIYVGVHKTVDLDDDYMGSGKIIRSAIEKYGVDNFSKRIIETFDNSTEMYTREAEIVTEEFLMRADVYNLRRGGSGGFEYINKIGKQGFSDQEVAKRARRITREILIQKYGSISEFSVKCSNSDAAKIKRKNTRKERNIKSSPIHAQTPEANAKRIKTMRENGHQAGQKNSQYGKMWITDGAENKSIFKTDVIPEGWRRGRVLKPVPLESVLDA